MVLPTHRPAIMAIVNVTPDSFSDGGQFTTVDEAVDFGVRALDEGADMLDVGGESTRPGAEPVAEAEELGRVLPVVSALAKRGAHVSIDTMKPSVAREALLAGAQIVNDVSGLRDPKMIEVCAGFRCRVCIMHMLGSPRTMQQGPIYGDVVRDVREYLVHAASLAIDAGVQREDIWIDPGLGFGKTTEQNLELVRRIGEIVRTGFPVLIGASRKTFIGKTLGTTDNPLPVTDRLEGTLAVHAVAQLNGARILRVHDVKSARRFADMIAAITL